MNQESPIFAKSYDFLHWFVPVTSKFPREHRFGLTSRLQNTAYRFYELLYVVSVSGNPNRVLARADVALRQLKAYWRLAYDLAFMPIKRYEHGSRLLDELGRLLGGWLKSTRKQLS